ncbi:MAG: glutamine--fructose-6-phosphate transaminase (isomerizing) [Pseudomonadota bacterium]
MCGIVGYVAKGTRRNGVNVLLEGLRQLEYRGYDSAGIALVSANRIRVHKRAGKVRELEAVLPERLRTTVGIAHTRWATHGEPNDANAHPHLDTDDMVAVVHNGIIENADRIRARLEAGGQHFRSDTDTELLSQLIAERLSDPDRDLISAVRNALDQVQGTYGIAVVSKAHPDQIVVARNGSPVILGIGDREMFVASDVSALVRHTRQVVHLDDGEIACLQHDGYKTETLDAKPTTKTPSTIDWEVDAYDAQGYEHFMAKEIFEQVESVKRTITGRFDTRFATAHLGGLNLTARDVLAIRRIKILGCGSAYYAGLAGAHTLESLTRVPSDAEAASEFRYRNPVIENDVLYIAVSQSGETLDTLMAVEEIKRKGGRVLGVVNVVGSTIARSCDGGIYIHAGPEVSVASTKTFTSTGLAFLLLALYIGRIKDLGPADGERLCRAIAKFPDQVADVLARSEDIATVAKAYAHYQNAFFIGRAGGYPIALEGAQKLKEISYVHAEAYPAAELKHGPLALVSEQTPTIVVMPQDELYEKLLSSIEEIRARRGPVVAVVHDGDERASQRADHVLTVPKTEPELDPWLMNIALQLFAYHAAVALGRDIDQPRNLAKSVTVE